MGKIRSFLSRMPKRLSAFVAVIAAAVIIPTAVLAWGPDRTTYTIEKPATKVTFNSITNNPVVGDERDFVVVKDAANTSDGGWKNTINVEPGKEYLVRVYVHNNAAANLNLVAKNTRVSASVPTTTGKEVSVSGFVTADNASPQKVWDDITFKSDKTFNLAYVSGSAEIWNNGYAKTGKSLPDSIVTSAGALVGYDKADGNVPGCFEFVSYVYFKVKPQFASDFTVNKLVSKHGENKWVDNYKAKPGETVDYLIEYRNTGASQQDNVTVRDTLPAGMSYVPGSTLFGTQAKPQGVKASDNIANGVGINIGSYLPGAGTWVMFSAKVASNNKLPVCGTNKLINKATVTTGGYSKEDDATVVVKKECEKPKEITVCDLETKKIITIDESEFDQSRHSKDIADCDTPPELPPTGIGSVIAGLVGPGSLVASLGYYIASRRAASDLF